jgi:hypothetical protein
MNSPGDPVIFVPPSAYVFAAEEHQNDTCEDAVNPLFEFVTTEPAICPTA